MNDYLYHHGIKGMKWGVRRTPAQLGHDVKKTTKKVAGFIRDSYSKHKTKKASKKEEATRKKTEATEADRQKALERKKAAVLNSRSPKLLYENARLFTDQELQSAYNRLVLERNIANLTPKEKTAGQKFAEKSSTISQTIGNISKTAASAYALYNTMNKFMGNKSSSASSSSSGKSKSNVAREVVDEFKKAVDDAVDDKTKSDIKNAIVDVLYETPDGYSVDLGKDYLYGNQNRKRLPPGR